jgi:hypothetical protein
MVFDVIADREHPNEDSEEQKHPEDAKEQFAAEGSLIGGFMCDVSGDKKSHPGKDERKHERPARL